MDTMDTTDTMDHDLMDRLRAGETDRLGDLYDRHAADVLRHCRRMVGDVEAARDLTQEVFLRVLRYRSTWEGRSRFSTWLYRITRNVCLDHLKSEKRRVGTFDDGDRTGSQARVATASDTWRMIERRESTYRLGAALDRLSPTHREIILLIRYQDMSYEEVSRVLECSVNAARVRFHRALNALRDEYMKSTRTSE